MTYKTLEPGLEHLDRNSRTKFKKGDKPGVWRHLDLFDMGTPPQHQQQFSPTKNAADRQSLGNSKEIYGKTTIYEQSFYTPYHKESFLSKRFREYMTYLNTVVFVRKLDTFITNFLMRQFTKVQMKALGLDFKSDDYEFRNAFKQRYYKLIKKLRENLLKKKAFIQRIYSKIFQSSDIVSNIIYTSLENFQNSPPLKIDPPKSQVNSHNLSLGVNFIKTEQKLDFIKTQSKNANKNLKLPQVQSHKASVEKFQKDKKNVIPTSMVILLNSLTLMIQRNPICHYLMIQVYKKFNSRVNRVMSIVEQRGLYLNN